jgi:hypothetical protein
VLISNFFFGGCSYFKEQVEKLQNLLFFEYSVQYHASRGVLGRFSGVFRGVFGLRRPFYFHIVGSAFLSEFSSAPYRTLAHRTVPYRTVLKNTAPFEQN